jgi:hypothetical protein
MGKMLESLNKILTEMKNDVNNIKFGIDKEGYYQYLHKEKNITYETKKYRVFDHESLHKHPELVEQLRKNGLEDWEIARYVLSQAHWQNHPELVEQLIKNGKEDGAIAEYILSQAHWIEYYQELLGTEVITIQGIRDWLRGTKCSKKGCL